MVVAHSVAGPARTRQPERRVYSPYFSAGIFELPIASGPAMNTRKLLRVAGMTLVAGVLKACTTMPTMRSPTTAPASSAVQVSIDNFNFTPPVVTVPAGGRVVWVNHDDVPHTVTATGKEFTSAALDTDEQY
jgi:plastocyanin